MTAFFERYSGKTKEEIRSPVTRDSGICKSIIMKALKSVILQQNTPLFRGMGVGISLHSLAGAVAKAGGIGIISTAQIGFKDPEF